MTIEEMVDYIVNDEKRRSRFNYITGREDLPLQKIFNLFNEDNYSQAEKLIQNYLKCDEDTAKTVCMEFKTKIYDNSVPDCTNMTIEEMVAILGRQRYNPFNQLVKLFDNNNDSQAAKVIQNYLKCDEDTAKTVCMEFKTKVYDHIFGPPKDVSPEQIAYNNAEAQRLLNVNQPKCPTCGSTNIKRISGTERAISVLGLGIFSNKINKSYKCGNCKCTW